MTQHNVQAAGSLVSKGYISDANEAFGPAGGQALRRLLDEVILLFRQVAPENYSASLTCLAGISATPLAPVVASYGTSQAFTSLDQLGAAIAVEAHRSHVTVEVFTDATYRLLLSESPVDAQAIAATAVVYRYEASTDRILAGASDNYLEKLSPILRSNFAVPTVSELEDVFRRYAEIARNSSCRILATVWDGTGGVNGPRLVLRNKPEATMRDSLCQAIDFMMRNAKARPEHNSDETKPVDIVVDWFGTRASALIEVKWMGKSVTGNVDRHGKPTYTEYDEDRAHRGAVQLEDYLERDVRHSHAHTTTGYLAVFDARRDNLGGPADRISKDDAMRYENAAITYNPDYSKLRPDFAEPVRFFLAPRESHFVKAAAG